MTKSAVTPFLVSFVGGEPLKAAPRNKVEDFEPTFNNWFRSMARPVNIELLNPGKFVIGHRFFQLLISKNWPLKEVTAFHSNYVVGEKAKYRRLKTIELRMHQDWRWTFFYLREIAIKLLQRLFTLNTFK